MSEQRKGLAWWLVGLGAAAVLVAGIILSRPMKADEHKESAVPSPASGPTERATLGGGCFWCTEAVFEQVKGVRNVVSGYAGGTTENPTYEEVCSGQSGHAEVIQIEFDPTQVSYSQILDTFWKVHNPTTLNRQGADTGTQYRSVIFYENEEQHRIAQESKEKVASQFSDPIVTQIESLQRFWPAEEYHQDYFRRNPNAPYCAVVIRPKLEKVKKH